jgi:hypothetical protein
MKKRVENFMDFLDKIVQIDQGITLKPQYTLVARLNPELLEAIESFVGRLAKTNKRHLYYDKEKLHVTIYGKHQY